VRFDQLLYSPWRRAAETAELLTDRLDGTHEATDLLVRLPTDELLARFTGQRVAVVGHQPWLGALAAGLVFGEPKLGARIEWKKGGMAVLTGDPRPGGMLLKGFWAPGVLRRVG
jgi:phosphohistidine phosphatase SixA